MPFEQASFLSFFLFLPSSYLFTPPSLLFTLREQRCAALRFSIELRTLHHFISVSISETASCSRPVFVILFVSHLCPIPHTPPPAPTPSPSLRLGTVPEAQTESLPKWRKSTISHHSPSFALAYKVFALFFFLLSFYSYSCPPKPFHPFLRNPLMQCSSFAESQWL